VNGDGRAPARPIDLAILLALATGVLVVDFFFAQRVPLDTGFHWDGTAYIHYARNIDVLWNRSLDAYSYGRVLPSALVHFGLRLAGQPLEPQSIVGGFVVLNGIAILLALTAWGGIARTLRLTRFQLGLGAAAFFVNFCFLKYNSYYPITTDVTAFAISLWMIRFYLAQRQVGLFIVSLLGAFAWPTFVLFGAILLALPAPKQPLDEPTRKSHDRVSTVVAAAAAMAACGYGAYVHYGVAYRHSGAPTFEAVAPLSLLMVGVYAVLASRPLLAAWPDLRRIGGERPRYALHASAAVLLVLAAYGLIHSLAAPGARNTPGAFAQATIANAIKAPGIFIVAHFAFFGPILALAIVKWRAAAAYARRLGPGFVVAMLLTAALAVGPESRQLMANIAFIIIPVVAVAGDFARQRLALAALAIAALALSRMWITLDPDTLVFAYDAYLKYPWQKFFGAIGYWMTGWQYLGQGVLLIALSPVFALLTRGSRGRALQSGLNPRV